MKIEHLTVSGMSCGGCVTRVTEALTAIPGVGGVEVALSTGVLTYRMTRDWSSLSK